MSDVFGTYVDPILFTNADTQKAIQSQGGDSRKYYKIPILYLTIVECKQECRIYTNDSKTNLIAHVVPNTEATYYLDSPVDTLVFSWGDINERALPQSLMFIGYASQQPPERSITKGGPLSTLFRNSNPTAPAIEVVADMSSPVLGAMLALMAESDFIVNDTTLNTWAFCNAASVQLSQQQLLAVTPYLRSTGLAWDGTTTVPQKPTFTVPYRLAARPFALSNVYVGAGNRQYATIWHDATATKRVEIVSIRVTIESVSAACIVTAEVWNLTGTTVPATGNPIANARAHDNTDGVPEATCLCLPTTAGSVGSLRVAREWNLGITAAAPTTNPPQPLVWEELLPTPDYPGWKPLIMPASIGAGWAVRLDVSAAATVNALVEMTFTEV